MAPRTRAERLVDIVPAARPARKVPRTRCPDGTDGSPPKRARSKSNAGLNGAEPTKYVEGAPGVHEMTWSFSGPDGRATFEWVRIDGELAVRWRRIGGHRIFRQP